MRRLLAATFAVGLSACGGYNGSPVPPTGPSRPAGDAITIEIVGIPYHCSIHPEMVGTVADSR